MYYANRCKIVYTYGSTFQMYLSYHICWAVQHPLVEVYVLGGKISSPSVNAQRIRVETQPATFFWLIVTIV